MKREKIQAALISNVLLIKNAPFGEPVLCSTDMLMRVKPVNFLCNSTIINDMISKGNCLVVNTDKGTCYIVDGNKEVKRITSTLQWSDK